MLHPVSIDLWPRSDVRGLRPVEVTCALSLKITVFRPNTFRKILLLRSGNAIDANSRCKRRVCAALWKKDSSIFQPIFILFDEHLRSERLVPLTHETHRVLVWWSSWNLTDEKIVAFVLTNCYLLTQLLLLPMNKNNKTKKKREGQYHHFKSVTSLQIRHITSNPSHPFKSITSLQICHIPSNPSQPGRWNTNSRQPDLINIASYGYMDHVDQWMTILLFHIGYPNAPCAIWLAGAFFNRSNFIH